MLKGQWPVPRRMASEKLRLAVADEFKVAQAHFRFSGGV
jgi:hypothetical protein